MDIQIRDFYHLILSTALLAITALVWRVFFRPNAEETKKLRTHNFATYHRFCTPLNRIGAGRRGIVYRGLFDEGEIVAIKKYHDQQRTPRCLTIINDLLCNDAYNCSNLIDVKLVDLPVDWEFSV